MGLTHEPAADQNLPQEDEAERIAFIAQAGRVLDRRTKRETCPFCDTDEWFLLDQPSNQTAVFSGLGPFVTYSRCCSTCGYVRQHLREILEADTPPTAPSTR